jgi:lysophospholipase L1-like esterase
MKRILCFGDSNTWGAVPIAKWDVLERYAREQRWGGVLARELGEGYEVIEEGDPARTTIWDDPVEGQKNGRNHLIPCLDSHQPLDLVIIMLGTNDLKHRFSLTAFDIARSAGVLVDMVRKWTPLVGKKPQVLLIAPPPILPVPDFFAPMFVGAQEKSKGFPEQFRWVAEDLGCPFLDASEVIQPSTVDGIHCTEEQHARLGKAVAQKVRELLG